MDEQAVVDVIGGLTPRDFDKSMPSEIDPKFTLDAQGQLLLISFKENQL